MIKKIVLVMMFFSCLILTIASNAQYNNNRGNYLEDIIVLKWESKSPTDVIVINNGTSLRLIVQINVGRADGPDSAGISLRNCGATGHVNPGNIAICFSNNARRPVAFSSDSGSRSASGTYIIRTLD